jgi:hypothetical protein
MSGYRKAQPNLFLRLKTIQRKMLMPRLQYQRLRQLLRQQSRCMREALNKFKYQKSNTKNENFIY